MNPILPDILQGAAVGLERNGWCQEIDRDPNGCMCMRAAIKDQVEWSDTDAALDLAVEAFAVVAPLLDGLPSFGHYSPENLITYWNDMDNRTADEVIAKLREAADAAEAVL